MKLRVKWHGGVYRLAEREAGDGFPFGIAFVCEKAPDRRFAGLSSPSDLDLLNMRLFVETSSKCGGPARPDAVSVAHGMCEDEEGLEVLEYEPEEYPADAVF